MKISVLQPNIVRGDIKHNVNAINRLLEECKGSFAVTAEYALTGSLVLDADAEPMKWAGQSEEALKSLVIPKGKTLLINHLTSDGGKLYNQSTLLPEGGFQRKCFPDPTELAAGILPGDGFPLFDYEGKKYKVIICTDLRNIDNISTEGADFAFFVFHFTPRIIEEALEQVKALSAARGLPIIVASLVSDKNCGHSMYVNGSTVVSLGDTEGVLEISLE